MKKFILGIVAVLFLLTGNTNLLGQKFFTRDGQISFISNAPMEEIKAINEKATCVIDAQSGAMEWAVLIKAFKFKKALMEEHFNENYMESTDFPKAFFKGSIEDPESIKWEEDGRYTTKVNGQLEIKGVQMEINPEITIMISNGKIKGTSTFKILVADYNIEIPKVVRENIAKEVEIKIDANFQTLN